MSVLRVVKTSPKSREHGMGFKFAVVGPGGFFMPYKTKGEADRGKSKEEGRAIKVGLDVIYGKQPKASRITRRAPRITPKTPRLQ